MATTQIVPTATKTASERRRGRPRQVRMLPLQPILDVTRMSPPSLAGAVHRSKRDLNLAARDGVTVEQAWTWCDRLRVHPAEIWGATWWEVAA